MSDSTTTTKATTKATDGPSKEELIRAFETGVSGWIGGTVTDHELQELLRPIHSSTRTGIVGRATKKVLGEAPEKAVYFIDLTNELPSVAKSTRTKATLADEAVSAYKATAAVLVEKALEGLVPSDGDDPELAKAFIEGLVGATVGAIQSYSGATRKVYKETLAQLIERGAVKASQKVTGPNGASGTIKADGTISSNGTTGTPSATAAANVTTKSGKAPSVNGWDFWNVKTDEGTVALGSLRTF